LCFSCLYYSRFYTRWLTRCAQTIIDSVWSRSNGIHQRAVNRTRMKRIKRALKIFKRLFGAGNAGATECDRCPHKCHKMWFESRNTIPFNGNVSGGVYPTTLLERYIWTPRNPWLFDLFTNPRTFRARAQNPTPVAAVAWNRTRSSRAEFANQLTYPVCIHGHGNGATCTFFFCFFSLQFFFYF
jgi:hypothetical protein